MRVKVLEWDSNFFNKKIAEVSFDQENDFFFNSEGFDLLYIKQKEDKPIEIDDFNLTYTETKVVFSKSISRSNNPLNGFIFSAFDTDINREQIYKLAFESGKFSRFKLDDNFQKHEFEALYKKWVDNSFRKEIAHAILVYKEQSALLGFITYKIIENNAIIGLLGVCDEQQGKGIGRKLLEAVENELSEKLIKELRIPTQLQNEQACGFYTKLGYNIIEKTTIKHYWRI